MSTKKDDPKASNEDPGSKDPKNTPTPEAQGDNLDEFGYEKVPAAPGEEKPKGDETPKEDDPSVDPLTGYEKEPVVPEEKPKPEGDKTPADKKPEAGVEEFDIKDPGDLLPEEVSQIKDFVKKHKVSKEVAEALVADKKAEVKKINDALKADQLERQEKMKVAIAKQKKAFYDELKSDKDFGGANFDHNIKQVDKVLQDFFPNVKKKLTEDKSMLPPYIMRDLAALAKHLNSTPKLVNGGPVVPKTETEEDDPLAFYNS